NLRRVPGTVSGEEKEPTVGVDFLKRRMLARNIAQVIVRLDELDILRPRSLEGGNRFRWCLVFEGWLERLWRLKLLAPVRNELFDCLVLLRFWTRLLAARENTFFDESPNKALALGDVLRALRDRPSVRPGLVGPLRF